MVLIHQYPAKACEQTLPELVGFLRQHAVASQESRRLFQNTPEVRLVEPVGPTGEARPGKPHSESVTGEHDDAACVVPDELREATANLHGRMPVICQRKDGARILAAHPHQVGDSMNQHPGLPGARAREHQHVRALAVVHHDAALIGVSETVHDLVPRLTGGLPGQLGSGNRQPALEKVLLRHNEVVHCQPQRISHRFQACLGVAVHDVDLDGLLVIVHIQWSEVGCCELAPVVGQPDSHRRTKHRQSPVKPYDLLLVKPHKRPLHQTNGIARVSQRNVRAYGIAHLAQCGLCQKIDSPGPLRQGGQQMLKESAGGGSPDLRGA